MSTTSNYLLLLLLAGIAGGVVGVVVHAARAIIAENEVPDYDNGFVIVQVKKPWLAGNPFFERRVLKLDYNDDGGLIITREHDAKDPADAAAKCVRAIREGLVSSVGGKDVRVGADAICVHSDTPNAVDIAAAVKQAVAPYR